MVASVMGIGVLGIVCVYIKKRGVVSSNLKTNSLFVVKEQPQWIEFWVIIQKDHMALSPNKEPW